MFSMQRTRNSVQAYRGTRLNRKKLPWDKTGTPMSTPSRRDLRDTWRAAARARRAAGDMESAKRASRAAREIDKPIRNIDGECW